MNSVGNNTQIGSQNTPQESSQPIQGRSVFIVESTENGIAVQTSFMAEDGRLLQMACLFPDIEYALAQIDEMRRLVLFNFSKAAQIGLQINSENSIKNREKDEALALVAKHELNQLRS